MGKSETKTCVITRVTGPSNNRKKPKKKKTRNKVPNFRERSQTWWMFGNREFHNFSRSYVYIFPPLSVLSPQCFCCVLTSINWLRFENMLLTSNLLILAPVGNSKLDFEIDREMSNPKWTIITYSWPFMWRRSSLCVHFEGEQIGWNVQTEIDFKPAGWRGEVNFINSIWLA